MKRSLLIVGLLCCCILATVLYITNEQQLVFDDSLFESVEVVTDKQSGGNSDALIDSSINLDLITFEYTIGDQIPFPYLYISFHLKDKLLDLSSYDAFKLKIKADKGVRVPIVFMTEVVDVSNPPNLIWQHNRFIVNVTSGIKEYTIPFESLEVPTWWLTQHGFVENDLNPPALDKVKMLSFMNCPNVGKGNSDSVTIESLSFVKGTTLFEWLFYIGLLMLAVFLIFYFKRQPQLQSEEIKVKNVVLEEPQVVNDQVDYKENEINHAQDGRYKQVINFVDKNFANPLLSTKLIAKELGLSDRKITRLIRSAKGCSFKIYLNEVRIQTSKEYLKNTTLNVSEIAFKVGYNNVSHYNRVFKQSVGMSPSDFRKKFSIKGHI